MTLPTISFASLKQPELPVAVYSRVSTDKQETENQLNELREELKRLGKTIYKEYIDWDVSASTTPLEKRQHGLELIKDAKANLFGEVWVWRLDRLVREGIDAASDYVRFMKKCNVTLNSLKEPSLNAGNDLTRKIMLDVLSWAAEEEAKKISERTTAGLNRINQEIASKGFHISKKSGAKITHLGSSPKLAGKESEVVCEAERYGIRDTARKYGCSTTAILTIVNYDRWRKDNPQLLSLIEEANKQKYREVVREAERTKRQKHKDESKTTILKDAF